MSPSTPPFTLRRREWLLAALATLTGCGGGVDSGGTGTGAITLSAGPITGFGSIIVNGVRYDDSRAAVGGDLDPGQSLALGMQTEILASAIVTSGGVSSATASEIRVRRELVGRVEAIGSGQLTVLGQTVLVTPTTVFDDDLAGGLAAVDEGDILAVYGGIDRANDRVVATRIERKASVTGYLLRGYVDALNVGATTLVINGATVNWSAVPPADPAVVLAPGRFVELRLQTAQVAGAWPATALETGTPVAVPADCERAEVEGRITAIASATSFAVDGIPVDARGAAFPEGTGGLVLGAKVEVEGRISAGVLIAEEVNVESDDDEDPQKFEVSGTVTAVDLVASTLVVRDVTVQWTSPDVFENGTPADLEVGVTEVEVRGALSADGTRVVASEIKLQS